MKKTLVVFVLLTVSSAFGQQLSKEEKEILILQDQRSLADGKLVAYLLHPDDNLRYRAAIALANIQDTSTVASLLPLLRDATPSVRAAAAFALGQVGSHRSEDSLLVALQSEADTVVFGRIAEALGRCGTERALQAMVDREIQPAVDSARDQYLLAIARFAQRGIRTERSIWFCFDQLTNANAAVRWTALYALWRSAPLRIVDVEIAKRFDGLKKLTLDPSPDVRINLATLLGKANITEALDLLQSLSAVERKHNEWRVQVAIVRALGALVSSHE
ncbi:MAG: HEAT repeat domain-containing protein, partial [Bacteroidota bacterium]